MRHTELTNGVVLRHIYHMIRLLHEFEYTSITMTLQISSEVIRHLQQLVNLGNISMSQPTLAVPAANLTVSNLNKYMYNQYSSVCPAMNSVITY